MIGVYKITSPNGKIYIGSSINIKKRLRYYQYLNCNGQIKLFNSIKKYGWNNHVVEIIEECNMDVLYEKERFYGDLFNALGESGLNLILPKNGEIKIGVSEETRQKMSIARLGDKNPFFGKSPSDQHRELLRIAQTGRKHTMEHRKKVSENHAKSKAKVCVNIETGIFYDSIKDAAFSLNQIHSSLKNRVNGSSRTYTPIKII